MKSYLYCGTLALGLILGGCGGKKESSPADRVEDPARGTTEKPSSLSYGTVKGMVKKDVTTQLDLMEMFGGPNTMDTDREGNEVWVYERSSSVNDTAGSQQTSEMNAFFGGGASVGGGVVGGGVSGGKSGSSDQRRTVNSVRNLTVIVKFNPNKTVKDYSVRASSF